jgi:hypothetical protein
MTDDEKRHTIPEMLSGEPRIKELEAELDKANRYLNIVITQCHVYIPLREAIVKHLEKYRTK